MLKSCTYCGKIHDRKIICLKKKEAIDNRNAKRCICKKSGGQEDRFRWSRVWKQKTDVIRSRDNYLCQICIRGLYGTEVKYNPYQLSVHHIARLKDDYDARLDDDNLITLCRRHHEMAERGAIPSSLLRSIVKEQQGRMDG